MPSTAYKNTSNKNSLTADRGGTQDGEELKKGMNSREEEIENREGGELTGVPRIHVAGAEIHRWALSR